MGKRVQLQSLLEELLGSIHVYYQPPETLKLEYPCIIYSLNSNKTKYANDQPYTNQTGYKVTIIDSNPDSDIPGRVAMLPMCSFDRRYTSNNYNHSVYNLYY